MEQMIVQFPTCPCCTPVPADQGKGSPPESGVLVMTPPMIADGELLEVGRSTGWGLGGHRLASGWGVPTERRRAGAYMVPFCKSSYGPRLLSWTLGLAACVLFPLPPTIVWSKASLFPLWDVIFPPFSLSPCS